MTIFPWNAIHYLLISRLEILSFYLNPPAGPLVTTYSPIKIHDDSQRILKKSNKNSVENPKNSDKKFSRFKLMIIFHEIPSRDSGQTTCLHLFIIVLQWNLFNGWYFMDFAGQFVTFEIFTSPRFWKTWKNSQLHKFFNFPQKKSDLENEKKTVYNFLFQFQTRISFTVVNFLINHFVIILKTFSYFLHENSF